MDRGAGEESMVAEDIAAEVFDERFERNKERGSLCEVSSKSVFLDFMVSCGGVLAAFNSNS
uniref:Uncharacterized protein n=1 Tax=Fagus sylvatica TaxID=28930 RepID=A0A2N9ICM1_FAGSY